MKTIQPNASKKNKQSFALQKNIEHFCQCYCFNTIGFLTLTFADEVTQHKEATKRFNSLATNVLKKKYKAWIRISEKQNNGRWHFHLIVACNDDIRRNINFELIKKRKYKRGANDNLRAHWAYWRKVALKYGFGRTELLPIKKTIKHVAIYATKFIKQTQKEKGIRLIAYSKRALRLCTQSFSWYESGKKWRQACALFFALYKVNEKNWAYKYRDKIMELSNMIEDKQQKQTKQKHNKPPMSFKYVVQIANAIIKAMYTKR